MNTADPAAQYWPTKFEHMIDDMPLDANTPCGLFESSRGNRFAVVQDDELKLAIVLRHFKRRSFTWRPLTERRIAKGNWLGNCELELTHRSLVDPSSQRPGTLGIDERGTSLLCYPCGSDLTWRPFAAAPFSAPFTDYDGWRLTINGRVFFEQLPRYANWPKVMPLRFGRAEGAEV